MLLKLLLLFVLVPLIELTLLLQLASFTSWEVALLVVIVTGIVGTLLARSQGWKTFRRIQIELNQGNLPAAALLDAAMIFCAGALLLTPGMLTDAFGMSLLIPLCRRWYRRRLMAWIRRHFRVRTFRGTAADEWGTVDEQSRVVDSYVVDPPPVTQEPPDDANPPR